MAVSEENGLLPIGAGSGSFNQEWAKEIMLDEFQFLESPLRGDVGGVQKTISQP